jgi:tRNA G26 N,N-dimethylase Trm1
MNNESKIAWLCETCGLRIETEGEPDAKPSCPICQKPVFRIREIYVSDLVSSKNVTEFVDVKGKKDNYPSKRKLRRHIQTGARKDADGRVVSVRRVINADTDEYEEEIIDVATGDVIRKCKEPLSAHRGRGSERKKKW